MTPKRQRLMSAIALLLVFSLSQLYVHANLLSKSPAARAEAAHPARTGKLITRGNNPISLNGNRTHSGTTVLSGAQLQTPAGVEASVQLGGNGLLRLASETSLTLNFDDSSIDVTLSSGHATLTTDEGIRGSITTPDGKTSRNDVTKPSTIEVPSASVVDDGDAPLFAAAVEPVQSEAEKARLRACMRTAQEAYQRALRDARDEMLSARREAEAAYRAAMRAATNASERRAAAAARQAAVRKAQQDFRSASMDARDERMKAIRDCRNPTTQTTATDPLPSRGLDNGVGVLGGISNSAARKFGLAMLGGAIASSLIIINLDDKDPLLGINPSPSAP